MRTKEKPPGDTSTGGFLKKDVKKCRLLRCGDAGVLDQALDGGRGLGALGDPGVHFGEVDLGIALLQGRIVVAKDFQEATIALEALISSNNAVNAVPMGTFLTETNNNSHDM